MNQDYFMKRAYELAVSAGKKAMIHLAPFLCIMVRY